jgi:hypothetical protein
MENLPAVGHHNNIAPHLSEEDFAQRDAVTVVPPITMKHENRRSRGGKLWLIQLTFREYPRGNPMTYILLRLFIPLNRRLVHVQDVPLKQQERPNLDIVGRRELKIRIWNRKVGRNRDV